MELWILLMSLCGSVDNSCSLYLLQEKQVVIHMCVSRKISAMNVPSKFHFDNEDRELVTYVQSSPACGEV